MWIITPFQKLNINAAPGVGAVALDGLAPSAYISEISPASVGAIVLAGQAPTALVASFTAPGAGAVTLAGLAPTFNIAAAGHRYWRVTDMTVTSTDFQPEELQLWETSSVRADAAGTSLSTDATIVFGTLARLLDSDFGTYVEFFPWSITKTITWDFGAGVTKAVTGFKHSDRGGGGVPNAFTTIRAQYSDDNSSWTTFGDAAGFAYGSPLSAFVPFVVGVKVPSSAAIALTGRAPTVS